VLAYLGGLDRPWRELDARFTDRAFVTWGTS
jgi:hypothetical protein